MLRSHMAPVFYVYISEENNKIFSMSTDNMVKVSIHFVCVELCLPCASHVLQWFLFSMVQFFSLADMGY